LSRPFSPRNFSSSGSFVRVNGKIRAREVRVIGLDGKQLGILTLGEALNLSRASGVDLVEIAPTATPPVCRIVDYGKYRYEQAKKDKESKKHQHASMVKEVQLSPRIDPHDLGVKTAHAIGFLCEDMKVKVTLKFRGREMAHTEFGFQVVKKFTEDISPFGHPDFPPKLVGKGINVMISPLPRNKRAKNPNQVEGGAQPAVPQPPATGNHKGHPHAVAIKGKTADTFAAKQPEAVFGNDAFAKLDLSARQDSKES
jgi:translation initiation factor IF-3